MRAFRDQGPAACLGAAALDVYTSAHVDLHRTDVADLIWNWARAEVDSPRFGTSYSALPAPLLAALRGGARDALLPDGWALLTAFVEQVRRPLLAGLLRLGTEWHTGTMVPAEALEELRLVWFHEAVPSRRLGALVDLVDGGRDVEDSFGPNYRAARAALDVGRLTAAPIFVAERKEGPYGVLEGYTRCSVLLSRMRAGEVLPVVPVVVGVCARIREWRLHDNPAGLPLFWER